MILPFRKPTRFDWLAKLGWLVWDMDWKDGKPEDPEIYRRQMLKARPLRHWMKAKNRWH